MNRPSVFVSYSHEDEQTLRALIPYLEVLTRSRLVDVWTDRSIQGGERWADEIDAALDAARIAILLISQEFLASRFIREQELPRIMQRQVDGRITVLPVFLSPSTVDSDAIVFRDLRGHERRVTLSEFQGFGSPAHTLSELEPAEQKRAFLELHDRIVQLANAASSSESMATAPARTRLTHIPLPRNRNFTGREDPLHRLHKDLKSGTPAAVTQALAGLGGIGKTQLALEYCYRYQQEYEVIWWVRSEHQDTRLDDMRALGVALGLVSGIDSSRVVAATLEVLDRRDSWLLVFDNVENPDEIRDFLLTSPRGATIITSRYSAWGAIARTLKIGLWTPEEASGYLATRTGLPATGDTAAIAEEFGYLPLALAQVAAYVDETGCGFDGYRKLLAAHPAEVLRLRPTSSDAEKAIATVWEIAFERVRSSEPGAIDLLNLFAFMPPDAISRQLLVDRAGRLPSELRALVTSPLTLDAAIGALRRYSLVEASENGFAVHRLVQAVIRGRLDNDEYRSLSETAKDLENWTLNAPDERGGSFALVALPPALEVAVPQVGQIGVPVAVATAVDAVAVKQNALVDRPDVRVIVLVLIALITGVIAATYFFNRADRSVVTTPTLRGGTASPTPAASALETRPVWTTSVDNTRQGWNRYELVLTPANVPKLHKVREFVVDEKIDVTPLVVGDKLYVFTMTNTAFVFDVNNGAQLEKRQLAAPFEPSDIANPRGLGMDLHNIYRKWGITATPVIDVETNTIYVATFGKPNGTSPNGERNNMLWILDANTLSDKKPPVLIAGTADNGGGAIANGFTTPYQKMRAGLGLLTDNEGNKAVIVSFSVNGENPRGPGHGFVVAYDVRGLHREEGFAPVPAIWNVTPGGGAGGVWMSGSAPAIEGNHIYLSTGNGMDPRTVPGNFAECFVKLRYTAGFAGRTSGKPTLTLIDYWSAFSDFARGSDDQDLGSGGVLLIPERGNLIGGGKDGVLYNLNTVDLGKDELFAQFNYPFVATYQPNEPYGTIGSPMTRTLPTVDWPIFNLDRNLPAQTPSRKYHHISGSPVYLETNLGGIVYVWGANERLKAYNVDFASKRIISFRGEGTDIASGNVPPPGGQIGGRLIASSNSTVTGTAVVWGVYPVQGDPVPNVVHGALVAYDAANVTNGKLRRLFHSDTDPANGMGNFAKYSTPVVANGKVYVATYSNKVVQYGL